MKSPGFEELGRAKKLQSVPLSINNLSAFIPLIVGQNHLKERQKNFLHSLTFALVGLETLNNYFIFSEVLYPENPILTAEFQPLIFNHPELLDSFSWTFWIMNVTYLLELILRTSKI